MRKGTTPTHTFELEEFDTSLIKTIKISYLQRDRTVLVRRMEDCVITSNSISTKLSQEDTFLFDGNSLVTILIRILTKDGEALSSEPIVLSVGKCLDDEVLT